jgi:hypothetical protein
MAVKRPTGERPKQLSQAAKKIKDNPLGMTGNKYNTVKPSEAAAFAGKMRDQAKKKTAKSPTMQKIKDAKLNATPKKVASDANNINISDYKVQGTRTAMRSRMQADRAKTAGRANNVAMKLNKTSKGK